MKAIAVWGCVFLFCLGIFCIGLLAYRLPKNQTPLATAVPASSAQNGLPGYIVETDPYGNTYTTYVGERYVTAPYVGVPLVEGAYVQPGLYSPVQYQSVYTAPRANESASAYAVRSGARAVLCAPPDPYPSYRFFNDQIHFLERVDAMICPD